MIEKEVKYKSPLALAAKFACLRQINNAKIRKLFNDNDINLLTKTVKV